MKLILSLLLTTLALFANDAFINPKQLKSELINPKLIILDVTDSDTFKEGHIPSAVQANIGDFRHSVDKTYLLINSSQKIQTVARKLGINNDSKVLIYGHNKDKEYLKASYIALALIANGMSNVSLLNGGYSAWLSEYADDKDALSKDLTKPKEGNFVAHFNPDILVDLKYVKTHIGKTSMIEARPHAYFSGEKKSNGVKRVGHITGASSSNWRDKFDANERLISDKKLDEIFLTKNRLNPNKEVITYCTGGLEASMNWYILREHLHYKDVKIYDASMKEWGNLDNTPMEK